MSLDKYEIRRRLGSAVFFIVLFSPLWSYLFWQFKEHKILNVMIIDKTVLNDYCVEHRSFSWILNYEKIVKPNDLSLYKIDEDYKGFFPDEFPNYEINDLSNYSFRRLDSISDTLDMLYYTDAYGVYENDWKGVKVPAYSPSIYGGVSKEDILLMRLMKQKKKLLVGEFNILAAPTPRRHRRQIEDILGVKWTGWTARYFPELDTALQNDLPYWVPEIYMKKNDLDWNFKGKGMLLVHENGDIIVLQDTVHLTFKMPIMRTEKFVRNKYGILADVEYPFWFDIVKPNYNYETISSFNLFTTPLGDSLLSVNNLSNSFPAMIHSPDEMVYYFAGDFADNNIASRLAYFEGVSHLDRMIYSYEGEENYRSKFFWAVYRPMMTAILNKHVKD